MMFLKSLRKAPLSAHLGMAIVLFYTAISLFAPFVAPYNESEVVGDIWRPCSKISPLGTDHLGRDMLTRLIFGARNTISIAFLITLISFTMGIIGGFLAAMLGGWFDLFLSRFVDIIMAFPSLILALMVIAILGISMPVLILVTALLSSTRVYRLSRALGMDIQAMDYIEVARLRGEKLLWTMTHEILPNALPPLVAEFGLRFCFVFLFISSLSFLGLGIQPPTADWGSMVKENSGAISFGILTPLWPALAIAFLTIGVNLIVDWFLRSSGESRVRL
jgi:peptide/nickel transport system permease protein